ncbi:hypothetical protein KSS87_000216 [Heliosperma pusillum]|nr:hypothetical protein KSS87_004006 [Heliosperma pusillum]KAH9623403.1 hypothetical protein KSS87_000216 [Heliosperma pusillum]
MHNFGLRRKGVGVAGQWLSPCITSPYGGRGCRRNWPGTVAFTVAVLFLRGAAVVVDLQPKNWDFPRTGPLCVIISCLITCREPMKGDIKIHVQRDFYFRPTWLDLRSGKNTDRRRKCCSKICIQEQDTND